MIYLIDHQDSFTYNLAHLLENFDDVYVIQASGIVIKDSGYDIRQGDTIIVPPDLRPKESTIKEYATVVDIIFKTFTTIAILYSIGILQAPSAIGMLAF